MRIFECDEFTSVSRIAQILFYGRGSVSSLLLIWNNELTALCGLAALLR